MKFVWTFVVVVISFLLVSCSTDIHTKHRSNTKFVSANVPYSSIVSLPNNNADSTLFYGENALQFGKLWLPKLTTDSFGSSPLVIFVHGGCWLNAYSIDHSFPLTSALADNGIMVWSLEYRRTGDDGGGWPGTYEDVLLGIEYFLKQTQYAYDKSNVILIGHSAGGHLALLAHNALAAEKLNETQITKVIGLAAISDLTVYGQGDNSCQSAVSQFIGGKVEENQIEYEQANPAQQLTDSTSTVQRLLLHGTADGIVPISQSTETTFKAKAVEVKGAGHFDWLHPQSESFYILLKQIIESGK